MTNGEKLKEIFPYIESDETDLAKVLNIDNLKSWWNAEYKEPTTKNDLGVDCISRAYLYNRIKGIDHDEDYECDEFGGSKITYHTCDWDEVLREIEDAPSVTPQPTKNDLEVDWESYKDADGNSLDYLILNVLQNNFDCGDAYGYIVADKIIGLLPSVTPLSSELEKNSKKLEKDFGELDCISRKAILDELEKWDWQELYLPIHFKQMLDELPSVTPQEPKIVTIAEIKFDEDKLKELVNKAVLTVIPQEPKIGHWEHGRELSREFIGGVLKGIDYEDWHCSNCHCVVEQSNKPKWNYCPNCGSDNREVKE